MKAIYCLIHCFLLIDFLVSEFERCDNLRHLFVKILRTVGRNWVIFPFVYRTSSIRYSEYMEDTKYN